MRVKNISSTKIEIPELDLFLNPGDMGDLSSFNPKDLHIHKRLNIYFSKGILVNLGKASPPGSNAALKSARDRISGMGLTDYVPKPSSKKATQNNRDKIDALLRNQPRQSSSNNSNNQRYAQQYHQNTNPQQDLPENLEPKPKVKIDQTFRSMQLNPDGVVSEFGAYGNIETRELTGETTQLAPPPESLPYQEAVPKVEVKDRDGHTYNVSLDNIKQRLKRKCIGHTNSGKPCKKWAVHGFQSCLTHMSRSEKDEYKILKRSL